MYAADRWTLNPNVTVSYGAKYARYDYLSQRGLLSPTVGVVLTPPESSVRLNASVSRREVAPGAEEFLSPASGLWLPPQRTFSALGGPNGYSRERIDTFEVRGEKQFGHDLVLAVRAFKQQVDDQVVAMFGIAQAGSPVASIGHYYVASAGDFDARGWGVSLSRTVIDGVKASLDYTQTDADWMRPGADARMLARLAPSAVRAEAERTYDFRAAVESQVPQTLTRVLVVYKLNSGFASAEPTGVTKTGMRYDVQVNQGLPFLNFAASQWEALVSVRNMFREGLTDVSAYDELLVVRPPTRIVGGLSVRF
jgi:outer membrane receptor protein involved in Fe transport